MERNFIDVISDRITTWVGSTTSIVIHTLLFIFAFASHWLFSWSLDFILLVLTTVVSLEAIYLAIFIQRSVNQQAVRLGQVEDSIDDVEEALDDVEESLTHTEDEIDDIAEDTAKKLGEPLDDITLELRRLVRELKALNASKKQAPKVKVKE